MSRYQKGETNLDFTEARDSEWEWHQLGHMQVCTALQTDSHSSTQPLTFLQAGCPSCRPANSVKALKAITTTLLHPFNRLFSRTTWKSKTSLDLYEAGNDGVLGCSDISWTICKFAVKWVLGIPPHLAYVAALLCETLTSAKQAINDKLQGTVATYCDGVVNNQIKKRLLLSV